MSFRNLFKSTNNLSDNSESNPLLNSNENYPLEELGSIGPSSIGPHFAQDDIESQLALLPDANVCPIDQQAFLIHQELHDCVSLLKKGINTKTFETKQRARIHTLIPSVIYLCTLGGYGYFAYDVIRRYVLKYSLSNEWSNTLFNFYDNNKKTTCAYINRDFADAGFGQINYCSEPDFYPQRCQDIADEYCSQSTDILLMVTTGGAAVVGLILLCCLYSLALSWQSFCKKNYDASLLMLDEIFNPTELAFIQSIADKYQINLENQSAANVLAQFKSIYDKNIVDTGDLIKQLKIKNFANKLYFMANYKEEKDDKGRLILPPGRVDLPVEVYYEIFNHGVKDELIALHQSMSAKKLVEPVENDKEKGKEKDNPEMKEISQERLTGVMFNRFFKKPELNATQASAQTTLATAGNHLLIKN